MSTESLNGARFSPPRLPSERPGRSGGRRDTNRQARLDALCEAGLSLFLAHGIDGVTIDDITRTAGISKGGFYRYFQNKDELVATVMAPLESELVPVLEEGAAGLEQAADGPTLLAVYAMLATRVIPVLRAHPQALRLYIQERAGPPSEARTTIHRIAASTLEQIKRMTRASRAHGLVRDLDVDMCALFVLGTLHEGVGAWLSGSLGDEPEAAAAILTDITLHGMRALG